uniref:Cell growth-regulating nucleolar protein-like winged helix domain-containing protein n=1 Tax=Lactuca sativa TaxID=4236 RepID=A0A9R1WGI5_LACSA|nr:hypothetical protein LSAT_V11C200067390 [Lactuca sativa]
MLLLLPKEELEDEASPITASIKCRGSRYWVTKMHVDGFRFDPASIMTRGSRDHIYNKAQLVEASDNPETQAAEYEKEISPDWWGNKFGFVSGGLLGAQSKRKKSNSTSKITQNSNKRTAFYEEDQENLYKLVQDKATSGKQGLGIKDRPRKIAGVRFQGTKTSFSDSEREESESEDDHSLKKQKIDDVSESKVKLKKLCRKLLSQVPEKSLKLKKLKALIDENSSIFSNFSSKKDSLEFLRQKLECSEKFIVEGKRVSLSSK